MTNVVRFPFGSVLIHEHNQDNTEFKKILDEINQGGGTSFAQYSGGREFFHLNPDLSKDEPHLYIEEDDNKSDTHLKYGKPGSLDSLTLATYNSSVLAEDSPLTLNFEALQKVKCSSKNAIISSSSSSSNAQENDLNSGANFQFDFNFFCMCGAVGGVVLLVGALIVNPVVAIVGACMLGAGAAGMEYNQFFSPAARDANESTQNSNSFRRVDV
ncbi:MAG: hypothetical protein P1U36_00650 [Legionellaceae bacterium]|nr:hypothetical protein [Legionellaceae bacterium]